MLAALFCTKEDFFMAKLGAIIGIMCIMYGFNGQKIVFEIGLFIFGLSTYFWLIAKYPETMTWWGGNSKLPWAQDMADLERRKSEIRIRRIVDKWLSKRSR